MRLLLASVALAQSLCVDAGKAQSPSMGIPTVASELGHVVKPIGEFSEREIAAMEEFEGSWGFVRSEPADGWLGLRGEEGACGGPKALRIVIRQEATTDGTIEWTLRMHPDQPYGRPISSVDAASSKLTIEAFLPIPQFATGMQKTNALRREGDRLFYEMGGSRAEFERCR